MKQILMLLCFVVIAGCGGGGGSGSDSGVVLEGTLIQGETDEPVERESSAFRAKHSVGEFIEGVNVCALGACSITDTSGRWGFAVDALTEEVTFTMQGHGIDDSLTLRLPENASSVFMEFESHGSDGVHAHEIIVDGQTYLNEQE